MTSSGKRVLGLAFTVVMQILILQPTVAQQQSSDSTATVPRATASARIEMRADTEGIDFAPFLQSVHAVSRSRPHAIGFCEQPKSPIEW
jgi:hypothetical protein